MGAVEDVGRFGGIVLLVAVAVVLAIGANRLTAVIRIPAPALFLVVAAVASDLWPTLGSLSARLDERIVTVALVLVLFDGGLSMGWRRVRHAVGAVLWIGVAGTVVTAAGVAVAAHYLFGIDWRLALLLGTALAPTDPAVVFSVLGGREISGRSGTILEGESGANDPVGIALLIAVLGAGSAGVGDILGGVGEFALQMAVGLAVGVAGGFGLRWVSQHISLPNEALYPLRTLAGAVAIYGIGTVAHGSGFLAVFVAGILFGDAETPYKPESERFSSALASLSEIVAFTVLGLTVSLTDTLTGDDLLIGLALGALLIFAIRPVLVGLLIIPIKLRVPERAFVLWAGLKGAVPILLGLFVVSDGLEGAGQLYRIVFVVVLMSVVLQGGSVPVVAKLLKIPMHEQPPQPWATGLRLRQAPDGLRRYTVVAGAPADGAAVGELCGPPGRGWVSLVSRDGALVPLSDDARLAAGDEVLAQAEPGASWDEVFLHRSDRSDPAE